MINLKDKALTAYYENYKPLSAEKNGKKITGFKLDPIKSETLSIHENTYNTLAEELIVYGKSDNIPSGFLAGNGVAIAKHDIWQIPHEIDCRIERKNLCPPPETIEFEAYEDITKIEAHEDGTFDISTSHTSGLVYMSPSIIQAVILPPGTYTASSNSSHIELCFDDECTYPLPYTFTLDEESYVSFGFYMTEFSEDNIYIQIEKGETASEYFPYELSNYTVSCYGKNLYPIKNFYWSDKPTSSYSSAQFDISNSIGDYLVGKKITISVNVENHSGNVAGLYVRWNDGSNYPQIGNWARLDAGKSGVLSSTMTVTKKPSSQAKMQILLYSSAGGTLDTKNPVTYTKLQIELGSEATPFEEYISPITYSADTDGNINGIITSNKGITIIPTKAEMTLNCRWLMPYNNTSLAKTEKQSPNTPRPIVSAKGIITATGKEPFNNSNFLMLNETELKSIEVDNNYPYNFSETTNEQTHYYIADTFNKGVLTQNTALLTLNGSEDWSVINQDNFLLAVMPFSDADIAICSHYVYGSALISGEFDITDGYIRFNLSGVADSLEKWKEFLNINSAKLTAVQILYPLKTPIVKSLDTNLKTLPEYTKITSSAVEGYLAPILSGYIKTVDKEK